MALLREKNPTAAILTTPWDQVDGKTVLAAVEKVSLADELLEKLEIGSATKQDCKVLEISSAFPVLKRTEMLTVNLDELDYLAKRLASFDVGEAAQFQAMAHKLELFELKDLMRPRPHQTMSD